VNIFKWEISVGRKKPVRLKDRASGIESWVHYGNQKVAGRDPRTYHDIEAEKVNSSVYIASRAISDAVASLPVKIIGMETIGGIEREYEDQDHPAYAIVKNPNPTHSWIDLIRHQVKSYLGDGNAFMTIERVTGPNDRIEIWPRDPRQVKLTLSGSGAPDGYIIGHGTPRAKRYKSNQVIHVRDLTPGSPYYGISRINSVRDEIMMDHFANRFNSKFFEHGATLHTWFQPENNLSDDQHDQLLTMLTSDIGGVENAFKLFVNQYAGKLVTADIKHKDIAFGELLRHNREKIFGAFGLPPFRGGVMEYANYANALAQDLDFWNNTIMSVLMVFEAAFNKQLIWPIFGQEFQVKFDLSNVPALKGDSLKKSVEYKNYVDAGIMTPDEVRERFDLPPLPKDEKPAEKPSEEEGPEPEELPTEDEIEESERAIHSVLRSQYAKVAVNLQKKTINGSMMSILIDPESVARSCFGVLDMTQQMERQCLPLIKKLIVNRVSKKLRAAAPTNGGFNPLASSEIKNALRLIPVTIRSHQRQTFLNLQSLLADTDRYGWKIEKLLREVRQLFTYAQAQALASDLLGDAIKSARMTVFEYRKGCHK
jgi:HK97 family phage portal protein